MGVFDNIIADFKCPFCAYELTKEKMKGTWQTKATLCTLDTYKVGDKPRFDGLIINEGWIEIHHVCPKCKKFVQAEIEVKNGRLDSNIRYLKERANLNNLLGKLKDAKLDAQKMKDESRKIWDM